MFVVFLKFSDNKKQAGQFMEGHNAWVKRGIDDGVFVLVGSIQPNQGGGILAHGVSQSELERRLGKDPFVAENIVTAEIVEITPSLADDRLKFLLD